MIKLRAILDESAVDTYQTIGDFGKGASFNDKRDRALIVHPTAIQKVKDFFKNTTVNFDFYFVNLKNLRRFTELGEVKESFIYARQDGLGIKPDQLKDGKINKNNITVFFVGNTASEKVPMTSWTIAHRFGHVVRLDDAFREYRTWLVRQFDEILKLYNITKGAGTVTKFEKAQASLFNQIGTMRSAREGKIDRPGEFYYELLAQYLNNGKIKLNPLSQRLIRGHAAYGRKKYAVTHNIDTVNEILQDIETDFSYYADDILTAAVGKIYVM